MSLFIYPYKAGSKSVKSLAEALDIPRIKRANSRFQGSQDKTVINWGCTSLPEEVLKCNIINHPDKVTNASNKLKFFQMIDEHNNSTYDHQLYIYRPDWTTNKRLAERWINNGNTVVERHQLSAHSGAGIKIKNKGDVIEDCQLYVMYVKKKSEWRVHVLNGKVVDVQRKARDRAVPDDKVDWLVRNHDNGFIFARNEGVEPPRQVLHQAVLAMQACGLDFGAVDIIYNERQDCAYVLEVNTAPGLTGTTLEGYAKRFTEILSGNEQPQERIKTTGAAQRMAQSAPVLWTVAAYAQEEEEPSDDELLDEYDEDEDDEEDYDDD